MTGHRSAGDGDVVTGTDPGGAAGGRAGASHSGFPSSSSPTFTQRDACGFLCGLTDAQGLWTARDARAT